MKTGENNDCSSMEQVEQSVRKTAEKTTPDFFVNVRKAQWISRNGGQTGIDRAHKFRTQSCASFVIPKICIGKVRLGFGPENDFKAHPRLKILFLTSDHGEPAVGFFREAFKRLSSSFFWGAVIFIALAI